MNVLCDEYGCATISNQPGFPKGTMVGKGANGYFIIESGWYLGYDSNGHTTAYRVDVGPQRGYAPYKASKSKYTNHGTEACFDTMVAEIQEENPNFPISFDMINEMRAECGLPPEE